MSQGNTFVFQQDSAPSHHTRVCDTIQLLQLETPDFIGPDLWLPNSQDLNPVDYKIWGVMPQWVYKCRVSNVDELKLQLMLIEVWDDLQLTVIDLVVSQWKQRLRACVHVQGWHFENLLWACLIDTWIERTYLQGRIMALWGNRPKIFCGAPLHVSIQSSHKSFLQGNKMTTYKTILIISNIYVTKRQITQLLSHKPSRLQQTQYVTSCDRNQSICV